MIKHNLEHLNAFINTNPNSYKKNSEIRALQISLTSLLVSLS